MTEAAVHAARQGAEAFVAQAHQAHRFEHFVGAPGRDPEAAQSMRRCPRTERAGCPGTSPRTTPTSWAGCGMRCRGRPLK